MSERQTRAGNQEFQSFNVIENFDKQSPMSLHMKTKVVQHDPRMTHASSDSCDSFNTCQSGIQNLTNKIK